MLGNYARESYQDSCQLYLQVYLELYEDFCSRRTV